MHAFLFVFEFLGTTELLVIAVVALVLFGPRKLPEIGRSVGKALGEFKRASDDFKRTWEYEVELERRQPATDPAPSVNESEVGEAASLPAHDAQVAHEPTVARGADGFADEHAWDVATGRAAAQPTGKDDDELNAS